MRNALAFEYILGPDEILSGQRLVFDAAGLITEIGPTSGPFDGYFAVPGMPNAHSHAFQRALCGFGEVPHGEDSFWSWRESMYRLAGRITAAELHIVARQAFAEMLAAGYTSVAEFHYLHHGPDGARTTEMGMALIEAARDVGIRLVLLPVCYLRGGFDQPALPEQQRFVHRSIDEYARLLENFVVVPCGIAPHSLRAVPAEVLVELLQRARPILGADCPIHIHIAEQRREVEQCRERYGRTPVELLFDSVAVDARWNLVHATHAEANELERIAGAGARVVVCPLTEAYLGDGIFQATAFHERRGAMAIGSDSNVRIDAIEELRLLEYGQRLSMERRSRLATEAGLGAPLWRMAAEAGASALAQPIGALRPGCYADIVVLGPTNPPLNGPDAETVMDAWLVGGSARNITDVYVGGERRVEQGAFSAGYDASAFGRTIARLMRAAC